MGDREVVCHLEVNALPRLPEGRCALSVGQQDALSRGAAGGQCGEREQAKEEAEEETAERYKQHGGTPSDRLRKGAARGENGRLVERVEALVQKARRARSCERALCQTGFL
jgi:hypothetical protein